MPTTPVKTKQSILANMRVAVRRRRGESGGKSKEIEGNRNPGREIRFLAPLQVIQIIIPAATGAGPEYLSYNIRKEQDNLFRRSGDHCSG